jgi:serine/threonine protein kinase
LPRPVLPNKDLFIGRSVPGLPNNYVIRRLLDNGTVGSVFLASSDETKHEIACKIIERRRLTPTWQTEVHRANSVGGAAVVKFTSFGAWSEPENGIDCVVLCSEYVRGVSLRSYFNANKGGISVEFALAMLREVLEFLHLASQTAIQHRDLHAGNILVEDRSGSLTATYAFRITDFGVTSADSATVFRDDLEQFGTVLHHCLECIDYTHLSPRDKFVFNVLKGEIVPTLAEKDPTRNPLARNPAEIFKRLQTLDREFQRQEQAQSTGRHLTSPFDYLSCEQMGDSHGLLQVLYSDLFLGLPLIQSRNNLVLTGPRGCGKSTVFRSVSLRHRTNIDQDAPSTTAYVAVYYRCDDLYFIFPRYSIPQASEFFDIPLHFVTASLLSDLLNVLALWLGKHFPEQFSACQSGVVAGLSKLLEISPPFGSPSGEFPWLIDALLGERVHAAKAHRYVDNPGQKVTRRLFGPDVLIKACELLRDSVPALADRPVYFLIDDYSSPKITIDLQRNLNRLFMQRNSACFFKMSTESPVSYTPEDLDGKHYVESREFTLLNLGLDFLRADIEKKLPFLEDVLRKRLNAIPEYPVKELLELIGDAPESSHNSVALSIREGKKPILWGRQALASLCSGDIHYVIQLVGKMVAASGGTAGLASSQSRPRIPPEVQNKAIHDEAGAFLRNLRSIVKHGERLVDVVSAFGNVAASYLKFKNSKNEDGRPPHQASRIEPHEPLRLTEAAREVYNELLRYSVFIEDVRGKSRRGKVVPRLYLRRFLIPHFNLTFSTRDSLGLEAEAVELLLMAPNEFETRMRLKAIPKDDDGGDGGGGTAVDQMAFPFGDEGI